MADESHPINADAMREALKTVIDPGVGMNIVDLGLIDHTEVNDEVNGVAIALFLVAQISRVPGARRSAA